MIEFIEDGHIYLVDGVITPSVSEILNFIFPDKYSNVPKQILDSKAEYGSRVHEAIECLEKEIELPQLNYLQEASINQYKKLKSENKIEVIEQEKTVNYGNHYCGRFDMIANINGAYSLCDIKTTAQLDKESLSWQLSYYALAHNPDKYETEFEKFYAIWLPKKGLGEVVEIERKPREELLGMLKAFETSKTGIMMMKNLREEE